MQFQAPELDVRNFDQHWRLLDPLAPRAVKVLRKPFPAALFIVSSFSSRYSPQMNDYVGAAGQNARANPAGSYRREQLLGAAAADSEQRLDAGAVDPLLRDCFEMADYFR